MPRALDGERETALMLGAGAGLAAWADLTAIRQVAAQQIRIFVGHFFHLIQAKVAEFIAAWTEAPATAPTTAPAAIIQIFHVTIVIAHCPFLFRSSGFRATRTHRILECVVAFVLVILFIFV